MNAQSASDLANRLQALTAEADSFYAPHIKLYLEVRRKTMPWHTEKDDSQEFRFIEITDNGITFHADAYEENWAYGGHEDYPAQEITIPLAFFDDPTPFQEHAETLLQARRATAKKADDIIRRARIKELETQLAKEKVAQESKV